MHLRTKLLLQAAAEAKWDNTYGPVAEALKAWQAHGCPDLPPPLETLRSEAVAFRRTEKVMRKKAADWARKALTHVENCSYCAVLQDQNEGYCATWSNHDDRADGYMNKADTAQSSAYRLEQELKDATDAD